MLPLLSSEPIRAKIDTGAATSSIHAHNLEIFEVANHLDLDDGPESLTIARFTISPTSDPHGGPAAVAEVPVVGFRNVKSSNGHSELRPVVRTQIVLGTRRFDIDLTLADRDTMGYRMLLGRRALRRRFLVDPGKSFLLDRPAENNQKNDQERETA